MDLIILFIKFGLGGFWLGVRASEVRIEQSYGTASKLGISAGCFGSWSGMKWNRMGLPYWM
jgi:hypothetical protein